MSKTVKNFPYHLQIRPLKRIEHIKNKKQEMETCFSISHKIFFEFLNPFQVVNLKMEEVKMT